MSNDRDPKYYRNYINSNVCALCGEQEDLSVGLDLHQDAHGVCSECQEIRLTDDNYDGRHFDELITPDENDMYTFTAKELAFLLEEFSSHVMRQSWSIVRLKYACGRVTSQFFEFLQTVVGRD